MINNFEAALKYAKRLLGYECVNDIVKKVSDEFNLTAYEQEELSEELFILTMDEKYE
jgi:hypothetical protein